MPDFDTLVDSVFVPVLGFVLCALLVASAVMRVLAMRQLAGFTVWKSDFDRERHESTHPRDLTQARAAHETRLEQIIKRLGGALPLKIERTTDGKFRAWLGRDIFELSPLRASWSTRAGALRLLWREVNANGGLLTTMALENNPDVTAKPRDATISAIRSIA